MKKVWPFRECWYTFLKMIIYWCRYSNNPLLLKKNVQHFVDIQYIRGLNEISTWHLVWIIIVLKLRSKVNQDEFTCPYQGWWMEMQMYSNLIVWLNNTYRSTANTDCPIMRFLPFLIIGKWNEVLTVNFISGPFDSRPHYICTRLHLIRH